MCRRFSVIFCLNDSAELSLPIEYLISPSPCSIFLPEGSSELCEPAIWCVVELLEPAEELPPVQFSNSAGLFNSWSSIFFVRRL